jgi:hypothetical protein
MLILIFLDVVYHFLLDTSEQLGLLGLRKPNCKHGLGKWLGSKIFQFPLVTRLLYSFTPALYHSYMYLEIETLPLTTRTHLINLLSINLDEINF